MTSSGLRGLSLIAQWHGVSVNPAILHAELKDIEPSPLELIQLAERAGLRARWVRQSWDRIARAPLPALALGRDSQWYVVGRIDVEQSGWKALIQMPDGQMRLLDRSASEQLLTQEFLYLRLAGSNQSDCPRFGLAWFTDAILRYRRPLLDAFLISAALQCLALLTPLLFQVIMDKVLVNQTVSTLQVILITLIVSIGLETALTAFRGVGMARTGACMDAELGSRVMTHTLSLPLSYFESRRTGDTLSRIRELENIRTFLTGSTLGAALDLLFAVIFLSVLFTYNTTLALLVFVSLPVYLVLSFVFTPIMQRQLTDKFRHGSDTQSYLVETLNGIATVKSLALEARWQQRWQDLLTVYIRAGVRCTQTALIAQGAVSAVSRLIGAGILWLGAEAVMQNQLTVGELVAFNMIASQLTQPILRLSQWWNEWQQIGLSLRRLGDLMNTPVERCGPRTALPRLSGAIRFEDVSFSYQPDQKPVVCNLSFNVRAGEVIGLVGPSGSGKSTLVHLLQGLQVPCHGRILMDSHDIAMADPDTLRRQLGVVRQDTLLFSRTVRDNIALVRPTASLEDVISAARLAGAHDFICRLPQGYDTPVGENGTGLSGGQQQRIAIARALLHNPRILIFDEATSALDIESEQIIQTQMRRICAGRTVFIIAHRLTAVLQAHRILVMDGGRIQEQGTPQELLNKADSVFCRLYRMQAGFTARRQDRVAEMTA